VFVIEVFVRKQSIEDEKADGLYLVANIWDWAEVADITAELYRLAGIRVGRCMEISDFLDWFKKPGQYTA
jgi:hypothetical protein